MPTAYGAYPTQTDNKAITSLVLGILSLTCMGMVTGIPAAIVGVLSRKDIEKSGGALGGGGMALAGIITGIIGSVFSLIGALFMLAGIVAGAVSGPPPHSTYSPPPTFTPTYPVPSPVAPPTATGAPPAAKSTMYGLVEVIDLDPDDGPLRAQLSDVVADAADAKNVVVVQTTAKWCSPCRKFESSLSDPRVQASLKNVTLVRLDIDDWESSELKDLRMNVGSVPWFFKIDDKLKPLDAISSGEWDDDIPENIAPVMRDFMAGKLKKRRYPPPPLGEKL
jgi:hypothetical protein